MFPYADDTDSFSVPVWIFLLIGLNILFFVLSYSGGSEGYIKTIFAYGTIPARFFQDSDHSLNQKLGPGSDLASQLQLETNLNPEEWPSPLVTLFTAMFLHGGIFHLLGNMWFLWLFGDNVEDRFGKALFPFFYIICGLAAGIIHVALYRNSIMPAIGASGAIAGVLGAYIYMFPRGAIATLMGWGFYFTTVNIPAPIYLGIWFVLQLFGGFVGGDASNVAFAAHVGGFAAGVFLAMIFHMCRLITWYPGDRGYRGGLSRRPIIPAAPGPGSRRYTWRD